MAMLRTESSRSTHTIIFEFKLNSQLSDGSACVRVRWEMDGGVWMYEGWCYWDFGVRERGGVEGKIRVESSQHRFFHDTFGIWASWQIFRNDDYMRAGVSGGFGGSINAEKVSFFCVSSFELSSVRFVEAREEGRKGIDGAQR